MTSLSAAPNGTLMLATTVGIYYLPVNASQLAASSTGSAPRRAGSATSA